MWQAVISKENTVGDGLATYDPDALRDLAAAYTTEQLLSGLQSLRGQRAEHLLRCYTDPETQPIPPEERKQALYDYCVVPMAEERLTRAADSQHNPYGFPEWLVIAQSEMAEFIMEDLETRQILAETRLFGGDVQYLHNFANSVSAATGSLEACDDDKSFALGVITEHIRPWVLPEIRADELTLS